MAERTGLKECSVCGKLYPREQVEDIPDGFGRKIIPGPKSALGWSKVSERRAVRFLLTKAHCYQCLGYNDGKPKPESSPTHAAAAGFKRFGPNKS